MSTEPSARGHAPDRNLRWLLAALAVTALLVLVWQLREPLHRVFERTGALLEARPVAGAALFVALAAASAMLAAFSSAVLVPVCAEAFGVPLTIALLWLGWTLGCAATYGVGRSLGPRVAAWLAGRERLARAAEQAAGHVRFGDVVLLVLALPSELPGYVLGTLHFPWTRYVAAAALAELPYAVATTYVSVGLLEGRLQLLLPAAAALLLLAAWSARHLRRHA